MAEDKSILHGSCPRIDTVTAHRLFAWASVFLVAVGALLFIAALRAVTDPLTTAWLNQSLEPRTRATLLSMNSQADALGQSIGGPIVGVIAKYVAISVALTFSALILLPALAIYRIAFTQNSNSDDTDTSVSGDHPS